MSAASMAGPSQPYYPSSSVNFTIPPQPGFVQSPTAMDSQARESQPVRRPPGHLGEHEVLLLSFIYDYFYKAGMHSSAAALLREVPSINVKPTPAKRTRASKQGSSTSAQDVVGDDEGVDGLSSRAADPGSVSTSVDSVFDKSGSRTSTSPPSSTSSPPISNLPLPEPGVSIDVDRGFLSEWWAMFWDVYRASSNKPSSRALQLYVNEARQLKAQQSAVRNQSLPNSAVPRPPSVVNGMQHTGALPAQPGVVPANMLRFTQQHPTQITQGTPVRLANGQMVTAATPQGRALIQQHLAEEQEQARRTQQEQQTIRAAQTARAAQAAQIQGQQPRPVTPAPTRRTTVRQAAAKQQPAQAQVSAMPQYPRSASTGPDQATRDAHQASALEAERHYRASVAAQQQRQMSSQGLNGGSSIGMLASPNMASTQPYMYAQMPEQVQPGPSTPRMEHPPPLPPMGQATAVGGPSSSYVSSPGPMYTSAPTPKNPPPTTGRPSKRGSDATNGPAAKRRPPSAERSRQPRQKAASLDVAEDSEHVMPQSGMTTGAEGNLEDFGHIDFAALLGGGPAHTEDQHGDPSLFDFEQFLDLSTAEA